MYVCVYKCTLVSQLHCFNEIKYNLPLCAVCESKTPTKHYFFIAFPVIRFSCAHIYYRLPTPTSKTMDFYSVLLFSFLFFCYSHLFSTCNLFGFLRCSEKSGESNVTLKLFNFSQAANLLHKLRNSFLIEFTAPMTIVFEI